MTWTVELCDLDQGGPGAESAPVELTERLPNATVGIARHTARLASVELSLEDPAAELVSVGDTVLRITDPDWTDPVFVGRVNTKEIAYSGDEETLSISAADPLVQLAQTIVMVLDTAFTPDVFAYAEYVAVQQATIMADLVNDTASNGHGVVAGTTPSSVTRTMTFPLGSTISEALLSICGLFNGPEFELTPTEATDGTLATLNIFHPQQGSDLTGSVVLQIGVDENDNVLTLNYDEALSELCNRHLAIGDGEGIASKGGTDFPLHPAYLAQHDASIAQYGIFESSSSMSGTTEVGLIEASAKAIVAANAYPIKSFSVALDPDFDFGPDGTCWIGDTINLQAGLPNETLDLDARIASATLTEGENGDIDAAIDCELDSSSGVTAAAANTVIDLGDGTVAPPPEVPEPAETCGPRPQKKPGKGRKWVCNPGQGWVQVNKGKKKHKDTGL